MNNVELDNSWNILKAIVKSNGTMPNQILTRLNTLTGLLGKEMNWSQKDTLLYINLLIFNDVFLYKGGFIYLTEDGYRMLLEDNSPSLRINLSEVLPLNIGKESSEQIFYKIWEVIGSGKDDNPYYVDGKTYFNTIRRFISGLPPTYSSYTSMLHKEGKSTSRFEWGKDLFGRLQKEEIIPFLNSLSDKVNEVVTKSASNIEKEFGELDVLLQGSDQNLSFEEKDIFASKVNSMESTKKPKIFISHNSEDKEYAKALVECLIKLGLNDQIDIFCSSLPGFGCGFGKSFIEEIKKQYENHELIVIFIHSPRYYNSHVSLCEMGAAWILKNEYYSFLTKDCEFSMLDAVIPPTEIAFKAGQDNTYHLLNEFKDFVERKFGLESKSFSRWETIKSDFIKAVQ